MAQPTLATPSTTASTTASLADTATARSLMVDGQVRPNKVTDPRIIATMRSLPRERFVPAGLEVLAYTDEDVPLGGGRFLMEPMVIARLVQTIAPRPGERALVVGAGSLYGAALLAACGATVTALEEDPALIALGKGVLDILPPGVTPVEGKLAAGWKPGAPYDLVLIEGAVAEIPPAIAEQLKPQGGRLTTVLRGEGRVAQAVLAEPIGHGLSVQPVFDCAVPLLPGMGKPSAFVF